MKPTVVTVVDIKNRKPTMLMEPMVFYKPKNALDWLMDEYYLSDEWNNIDHKVNNNETKHMVVFENNNIDNSAHKIFIQVIEEESTELKRIMQFIQ